jgi:hypothetical protein
MRNANVHSRRVLTDSVADLEGNRSSWLFYGSFRSVTACASGLAGGLFNHSVGVVIVKPPLLTEKKWKAKFNMSPLSFEAIQQFTRNTGNAVDIKHRPMRVQYLHKAAHVGALVMPRQVNSQADGSNRALFRIGLIANSGWEA